MQTGSAGQPGVLKAPQMGFTVLLRKVLPACTASAQICTRAGLLPPARPQRPLKRLWCAPIAPPTPCLTCATSSASAVVLCRFCRACCSRQGSKVASWISRVQPAPACSSGHGAAARRRSHAQVLVCIQGASRNPQVAAAASAACSAQPCGMSRGAQGAAPQRPRAQPALPGPHLHQLLGGLGVPRVHHAPPLLMPQHQPVRVCGKGRRREGAGVLGQRYQAATSSKRGKTPCTGGEGAGKTANTRCKLLLLRARSAGRPAAAGHGPA